MEHCIFFAPTDWAQVRTTSLAWSKHVDCAYIANFIFSVCRLSYGMAPKLDGRRCPWKNWSDNAETIHSKGKNSLLFLKRQDHLACATGCNRCSTNLLWQVFLFFFGMTCCLQPQHTGEEGRVLLEGVDEVAWVRKAKKLDTILKNSSNLEIILE